MTRSEPERTDRRTAWLVSAGAFLLLLPGAFFGLPTGKFIVGAHVLLDGGVPYRDFWTMYAPGSFYLVAGLFALFGREILVQGIAVLLIRAASAGIFFRLARRAGASTGLAVTMSLVFAAMFWDTAPELRSYPPALLLLLLAVGRMLTYFETGRGLVPAGLLCGAAAWFKHDVGAYGAAACIVALLVAGAAAGARRPPEWRPPLRAALRLGSAAALTVLPVALVVGAAAGRDAWEALFVFPATVFAPVFGEAYPPVLPDFFGPVLAWLRAPSNLPLARDAGQATATWLFSYPPALFFLGGVTAVITGRRRLPADVLAPAVLFLSFLPFFWVAAHVQRNTHIYSMAVFSMLIGALLWRRRELSRWRPALAAAGALYAVGLAIPPAMKIFLLSQQLAGSAPVGIPGTLGVRASRGELAVYRPIHDFIREHVPEGEPIYSGVARHDAIVVGNPRFYYLTGRPGCVPWYELHPGIADSPAAQRETVRALDDRGVRCAVLWRFGWADRRLDRIRDRRRETFPELGATELDEFLTSGFRPVEEYGEYVVLWRDL